MKEKNTYLKSKVSKHERKISENCRFALEIRKRDGTYCRHAVLHSLFCGFNRVIKEKHAALSLFYSTELKPIQNILDGRLKELQATQQPFNKQSEALSVKDETAMWTKGISFHTYSSEINVFIYQRHSYVTLYSLHPSSVFV